MTHLDETAAASRPVRFDDVEPSIALQLSHAPQAVRYMIAIVLTAVVIGMAVLLDGQVAIPNLSLIFVIPVVVSAVVVGLGPSLCSALLSAVAYNYLLIEPRYSLTVDDPANVWAIGLLFVVGCIASAVASAASRKSDDLILLRKQNAILRRFSREVMASSDRRTMMSKAVDALESMFHAPSVVVLKANDGAEAVELRGSIGALSQIEKDAAAQSMSNRQMTAAGVHPFGDSRFDFWPVVTRSGETLALGVALEDEDSTAPGALVEIVGTLLGLALDSRARQA